jgi:hypothetical protein
MCSAMWKFSLIFLSAFTIIQSQYISAQTKFSALSSFELKKVTDKDPVSFHLTSSEKPLTLFIFLSPECPLSKNYTLTLNNLFQQYNQQVQFYGCVSGKGFSYDEIKSFVGTYKILFPFFVDENKKLTNYISATVTPEVMLLDKNDEMIYKGAIDDWVQDLGKQKLTVSKHYLQDAIESFLHHKPVAVKETKAYGCFINDY